ncbi:MAG: ribosome biogenesis GTPase Der [Candidatus Binatia bacterium]
MTETTRLDCHDPHRLPVLALVGRPNVGKSTLFNRLIRKKKAMVHNLPGITRDRNYGEVEWYGKGFLLIDTGGFESNPKSGLSQRIQEQSRLAMKEADVILFIFDGKEGLNPVDQEAVTRFRKLEKPVFFAVNKIDTQPKAGYLYEFYALGLSEIFPLSAEHGLGLSELMNRIVQQFSEVQADGSPKNQRISPFRLAIVGRPNVGKSSLVNRLLGYDRSVVDATPGTTRDALECSLLLKEGQYTLVDTAGIRRKARIADRIERDSVIQSLRSVDRGDLAIHLLDGPEGVTDQDAQILAYACQRGKGLVLAVNKWDLVVQDHGDLKSYGARVTHKLSFADFAPLVFISALTGYGIQQLMEATRQVALSYQRRIQTSTLNQAVQEAIQGHRPPLLRGREVKFFYATQTAFCPPTFTLFVNFPRGFTSTYRRYLVRQLRLTLALEHSPVRLVLRARRNQAEKKKK